MRPETLGQSPLVVMLTAPNPGPKTLSGTHTYTVGQRSGYVIDPGPNIPEYQQAVARWLQENGAMPGAILLTHGHPDHAPGAALLKQLLDVPVYSAEGMPLEQQQEAGVDVTFAPGQLFPVDGDRLEVVSTPGHTPDHVAFWLQEARIVFAGDTILGEGTTLIAPPEGDMARYMATLERLDGLGADLIAPGHGPIVTDPKATIEEYVQHRRQREQQILRALGTGPATIPELVARIYTDVDPQLHVLAAGSVEAQLAKIEAEGRVTRTQGRYELA